MADYLPIFVMFLLAGGFVAVSLGLSRLFSPHRPTPEKLEPYECGIIPEVEPSQRFPVKFYLVAMAFIVLDVEIVFLYPFATILRPLGEFGLIAMGVFLLVLLVPFGYLLSTGAIDWGPARQAIAKVTGRVLYAAGAPGRDGLEVPAAPEEKVA